MRHAGLVLWLAGLAWAQGMGPDAPADPAPQRECSSYTISIGIYTKFFYTCCGQMEEATPPLVNEVIDDMLFPLCARIKWLHDLAKVTLLVPASMHSKGKNQGTLCKRG